MQLQAHLVDQYHSGSVSPAAGKGTFRTRKHPSATGMVIHMASCGSLRLGSGSLPCKFMLD